MTYEKTAQRLESNRRFVRRSRCSRIKSAAAMPVQGAVPRRHRPDRRRTFFSQRRRGCAAPGVELFDRGRLARLSANRRVSRASRATAAAYVWWHRTPVHWTAEHHAVLRRRATPPAPVSAYEFGAQGARPGASQPAAPASNGSYVLAEHLAYCRFLVSRALQSESIYRNSLAAGVGQAAAARRRAHRNALRCAGYRRPLQYSA